VALGEKTANRIFLKTRARRSAGTRHQSSEHGVRYLLSTVQLYTITTTTSCCCCCCYCCNTATRRLINIHHDHIIIIWRIYLYSLYLYYMYAIRVGNRCRMNIIQQHIYIYISARIYFNGDDPIAERFITTFRNGHAGLLCSNGHPV